MARKRKLNTRVVLVLSILGGLVLLLGVVFVVARVLPKDVQPKLQAAQKAWDKGDLEGAEQAFLEASRLIDNDNRLKADTFYKLAQVRWHACQREEFASRRSELMGQARSSIMMAIQLENSQVEYHQLLADIYFETGMWQQFLGEAETLLKLDPKNEDLRFRKVNVQASRAGEDAAKIRDVIEQYKALINNANKPEYYIAFAAFLESVRDYGDPAEIIKQGFDRNPKSGRLAVQQAAQEWRNGRLPEAKACFAKAKELAGDDLSVWQSLYNFAKTQSQPQEQTEIAQTMLRLKKYDPMGYLNLADVHMMRDELDQAIAVLREGLVQSQTAPTEAASAPAGGKTSRDDARMRQMNRAELHFRLSQAVLQRLLDESPTTTRPDEAQQKLLRADAENSLKQLTALLGENAYAATSIRGQLALVEGNLPEAVRLLESSYQNAPQGQEFMAGIMLYRAYLRNGTPGRGKAILDRFYQANKTHAWINLRLADYYLNFEKNAEEAKKHITAVLTRDPQNKEAKLLEQRVAVMLGGAAPTDSEATFREDLQVRVQQMFAQGKGPEAIKLVEDVLSRQPKNLDVFNLLLQIYVDSGQMDKAKKLISETKTRFPEDKNVQAQLEMQLTILAETDPEKRYELLLKRAELQNTDAVYIHLAKARVALALRKKDKCEEFLTAAEKDDPKNVDLIAFRFELALSGAEFDKAKVWADKAAEVNADKCKGVRYHALLLRAQNKVDDAQAKMEQVLEINPDDKLIRTMLGEIYLAKSNKDKAREHFQYLAKSDATFFPGIYYMAKLTADDLTQRATHIEYVQRCLNIRPDHPEVRDWGLNLLEQRGGGDLEKAIAARRELYQREPGDLRNLRALARLYETRNRPSEARDMYKELLSRSTDPLPAAELYCRYLLRTNQTSEMYRVMEELLSQGRVDKCEGYMLFGVLLTNVNATEAEAAFNKAIAAAPKDDTRPLLAMAQFHARRGDTASNTETALQAYKQAFEFYQRWFAATPSAAGSDQEYSMLELQVKLGEPEKARARLEQIITADSGNMQALFALADLYRSQDKPDKALGVLDTAVTLNPKSPQPLLARSSYYQEQGDLPTAQKDIEAARALDPDSMRIAQLHAQILMRQHKLSQAVAILNEMLQRDKTYQPAMDLLVQAYMRQKDWNNLRSVIGMIRNVSASDLNKQVELHMIEGDMALAQNKMTDYRESLDAALRMAKDNFAVLAAWLDSRIKSKAYDAVLIEMKSRTGNGYAQLRMYEAAALLGKGQVAQANAILTPLVKETQGKELLMLLEYVGKLYKPADGLAAAKTWLATRDDAIMHSFLGDMLAANKDILAAEQAYRDALQKATGKGQKLYITSRMGQMFYSTYLQDRVQKQYVPKAVEAWKSVLTMDATEFTALNNLAYIFTDDLNDPAQGLPFAQRAARMDPQPDVLDTLGWTQAKLASAQADAAKRRQDLEASLKILQQAYDLEEQLKIVHTVPISYHLGWVHEQLGNAAKARESYRNAEAALNDNQKDPLYKLVKDALNRVKN